MKTLNLTAKINGNYALLLLLLYTAREAGYVLIANNAATISIDEAIKLYETVLHIESKDNAFTEVISGGDELA